MKEKTFTAPAIKRSIISFIERYFPTHVRALQYAVGVGTVILLTTVLILGWMSSQKVIDVVTEDFNQQQLVLARHAAGQIENHLNMLKKELTLLGLSPSVQYEEKVSIGKRMGITFSSIVEEGTSEIRYVESETLKTHVVDNRGYGTGPLHPGDREYLSWAQQEKNRSEILITDVFPMPREPKGKRGGREGSLILKMVVPVWEVSVDESHPVPTNKFTGVLLFVIDATALIEKIVKNIQSGKTGYAWVIDYKGAFLYHPELEFIGKNAFEARKEKKPTLSFVRIDQIQKEMMLSGKEGKSWYISGWHRGQEGEIKKLIAYAPINLNFFTDNRMWYVAVVAPISEVEGVINAIQIRQFLFEGIVIMTILGGGLLVSGVMVTWSISLKQQVEDKTRELLKSEGQFRSLVENADDIIFTVDVGQEGNILSMNKYGHRFFMKKPEDILGRSIATLFPENSANLQMQTIREVFKTKMSRQATCPVMVEGHEYWLSINFGGLFDEKGEVFAVLGIARDITERKKLEQQMFYTEKLASIGTLAAGVAHEINNPLAIILGFTDMILEKVPAPSELHDTLKTIEKHGINAKRVVENLLSFTRLSEHKDENIDINKNIETVLRVVGNTLTINNIAVNRVLSESLPLVKGDPGELQQVLFNIINNAVSVMKGKGILTIITRTIEQWQKVEIRISDTGGGIKKEHRAKMFDPLFTTKKVGEGTGLGLFVSYGIIAKHGGTITFETKTEEESSQPGTTFIITLPALRVYEIYT